MKHLKILILSTIVILLTSCFGDLDTVPLDPNISTSETFFTDLDSYKQVLAKIYAGLATTGQEGPAGKGDLGGIDEGFSSYTRQLWYQQELTTDEAVCGWNDNTIADFHDMDWTSSDVFINGFYNRVFYQVAICNEFLRQTTEEALNRRDADQTLKDEVNKYRVEARFMRAMSYWHALDAFRNVPFTTEEDQVGSFFPEQIQAPELFDYIESELLAIEDLIPAPRSNEYGRADQAAVWAVLSKLYLNAEVYIGENKYAECLQYCKKILNAGYQLEQEYANLFLADNHNSDEIIFPVAFDGQATRSWGGTTFIIHASIGGDISPIASGVNEGWGGLRTTPQVVNKFGSVGDGTITPFGAGNPNLTAFYISQKVDGEFPANYSENQLASINSDKVFEGFRYFNAGDEFVFKTTSGFGAKTLGDDDGDGVADVNGAPLTVTESGIYKITIDRNEATEGSYTLTKVDISIVGDGVSGGSQALTYDSETGFVSAALEFLNGSFTVNISDGTTLGKSTDGVLTYGGESIPVIATPGTIELDLLRPTYKYKTSSTSYDRRAIFGTTGQNLEILDITDFKDGYAMLKFKNIDSNGGQGSDGTHVDTDLPLFRLADFYLMAAECILRGAPGTKQEAADYFNAVRSRAYRSSLENLTAESINLQEIIDERARELSWEGHRRTDLIRFNQFTTSDYLWAWKGGVAEGKAVESFRKVFPIPSSDLNNNPNLVQNDGY